MKTITWEDFFGHEQSLANRLIDYYEGDQLKYVRMMMDGNLENGMGKRHDWRERGFVPRQRNVTKAIVDKRAPLFNKPPTLEVWTPGSSRPVVDQTLSDMLYKACWQEFFSNVDTYTSLLKTTYVLAQKYVAPGTETQNGIYRFNADKDALMLTLLHRGNSVIRTDISGSVFTECAWLTSAIQSSGDFTYRVMTLEAIIDVKVEDGVEYVQVVGINEDQIIPLTAFHDTAKPRTGCWNKVPEDLPSLQEMINLALTDTEFAMAWQKQKTLFVTSDIVNTDKIPQYAQLRTDPNAYQGRQGQEDNRPSLPGTTRTNVGGLGSVVRMKPGVNGQDPMVKFDGPETDLSALNTIAQELIEGVAMDWSVQLKMGGSGTASSGFQLIVQEMPNLQLREKRAQMFQGAMNRFYKVMQVLYPELTEGELIVKFAPANLPVNSKEVEELWTMRINGNRASTLDYFMEVHGMTREEALTKMQEIIQINEIVSKLTQPPAAVQPQSQPEMEDDEPGETEDQPDDSPDND